MSFYPKHSLSSFADSSFTTEQKLLEQIEPSLVEGAPKYRIGDRSGANRPSSKLSRTIKTATARAARTGTKKAMAAWRAHSRKPTDTETEPDTQSKAAPYGGYHD